MPAAPQAREEEARHEAERLAKQLRDARQDAEAQRTEAEAARREAEEARAALEREQAERRQDQVRGGGEGLGRQPPLDELCTLSRTTGSAFVWWHQPMHNCSGTHMPCTCSPTRTTPCVTA